jgi:orotate phosphoribosyltransferase
MPEAPSDLAARLADDLLRVGSVVIRPDDPFTWASGTLSPIYCDSRLTIGHPDVRCRIRDGFADAIAARGWKPDVIAGTATAGIPHAAWLADLLDLPMAYVRGQAKAHGKGNQIEGPVQPDQRVVLVEDLVSTGGSSIAAAEALREAGADVVGVLAVFSYAIPGAHERFDAAGLPLAVLTTVDELLPRAVASGKLAQAGAQAVRAFRDGLAVDA